MSNNKFKENDVEFLNNLTLADPSFMNESEIDIILGASEYARVIKLGLMKSENNLLAQNTEFGWIISGALQRNSAGVRIITFVTNVELQQSVQQFFNADEFDNDNKESLTEEEQYCENHYQETIKRNEDGRFVVTLPFKNQMQQPDLGDSQKCAIANLFQLEKRFVKNPNLQIEYSKFIREGIELGHIEEAP